jgi:hypothetical protein
MGFKTRQKQLIFSDLGKPVLDEKTGALPVIAQKRWERGGE